MYMHLFTKNWRERLLLAFYHLRVLKPFSLLLIVAGFVGAGAVLWVITLNGRPISLSYGNEFSRFVMESGAALIAGISASTLIVGDSALEMLLASRQGIQHILMWRAIVSWLFLGILTAAFFIWSSILHIHYTPHDSALVLFSTCAVPVFLLSMIALGGALLTKSSALGAVLAGLVLMIQLLAKDYILVNTASSLFFIPLTLFRPDSPIWWWNRLVLLGCGAVIAIWCLFWLRCEERLLGANA